MKKPQTPNLTRRAFMKRTGCAALGSTALYSTLLNVLMTNRLAAQTTPEAGEYKALVCLFLSGGNDSYNMLVPREDSEYAAYASSRGELALGEADLFDVVDATTGKNYGIHNSMPAIRDLYNSGDLAFVCNTGTLVEPTTLADVENDRVQLPLGLYSHADQAMHWQTSTPDRRGSIGWLGRAAEVLNSMNAGSEISMNISLAGSNILQSGPSIVPYALGRDGAITLNNYDADWMPFFRESVDSILDHEYQNLLQRTYANSNRGAIDLGIAFNEALALGDPIETEFPDTDMGRQLNMVARSIASRDPLSMSRQSFFNYDWGWDNHDALLEDHASLLGGLSEAIGAFWAALGELGVQDQVTVFTASDFGRTLSSNGDGTDHAWGGNHMVLGGGLNGGRLYGEYPDNLAIGNSLDTGRGRLVPTTSVDEYFAEFALWLGAQSSDLPNMLPNLDRFYDTASSSTPLGLWS